MLLDGDATKAAMTRGIADLVDTAAPGDVLYLHYSGHGSNVPDTNGDEVTDHRDEILCPHDLDWNDPLTDDWLRAPSTGSTRARRSPSSWTAATPAATPASRSCRAAPSPR